MSNWQNANQDTLVVEILTTSLDSGFKSFRDLDFSSYIVVPVVSSSVCLCFVSQVLESIDCPSNTKSSAAGSERCPDLSVLVYSLVADF